MRVDVEQERSSKLAEDRSEKETIGELFIRRNKSLDYFIGAVSFTEPTRIDRVSYQTEIIPPRKTIQKMGMAMGMEVQAIKVEPMK